LAKVVLPLYQADAECVSRYSQPLFSLVNRCVFKQPALVQLTVTSLLRSWPRQCTFKQGIFLNQLTGLFLCLESAQKEMAEERKSTQQKDTTVQRSRASIKSLDMGRASVESPGPPKRPTHKSLDLSTEATSPRSTRSGSGEARKERLGSKDRKPPEDEVRPGSPPKDLEPRGSFKNLPGIFMHVEEVVNPYDFVTPVAEPLFKKLLECINHSQVHQIFFFATIDFLCCRLVSPKLLFKCCRFRL